MSERQGIEIDYCPQCRGVWLDRGELDKIIERSQSAAAVPPPRQSPPQQYSDRYHASTHAHHGHKKKREGFLSDLFDF
jgi:Zn-finger nucleic acid-binding protein